MLVKMDVSGEMTALEAKRGRRLTDDERRDVLQLYDGGLSAAKIGLKFGLSRASISKILRNKQNILNRPKTAQPLYRQTAPAYPELEQHILDWMDVLTKDNVKITGSMIRNEAQNFAKNTLGQADFKASEGWLRNFRRRHSILLRNSAAKGGRSGLIRAPPQRDSNEATEGPRQIEEVEILALGPPPLFAQAFHGPAMDPSVMADTLPGPC